MPTEHEQELMALRQEIHDLKEEAKEPCPDCETYAVEVKDLQKELDEKDEEIQRLKDIIQDAYSAL